MDFCLKLPQGPFYTCANSKGSGETALTRRLASAFDGHQCDNDTFPMCCLKCEQTAIYWNCIAVWRKIKHVPCLAIIVNGYSGVGKHSENEANIMRFLKKRHCHKAQPLQDAEKKWAVEQIQSTLVTSNSKGLYKILRDIRTSTYQICRIEEKTNSINHI